MKTILVIGDAGFVGGHARKALTLAAHRPMGLSTAMIWQLNVDHSSGVSCETKLTSADLSRCGGSGWLRILLRMLMSVGQKSILSNTAIISSTDQRTSSKCLRSFRMQECRVFRAMYRIPYRVPLTDEDVRQAVNPNDRTKLVVERMLRDVEVAHGIRHLALRYFNSIGPELGNLHEPETHLIPRVLLRPGDGGLLKDLSQHGESLEIAFRQQEIMA